MPQEAAVANMKMALEYMRINNLAQARERIERALGEAPDNPNVQETAGLVYERLNELPKAKHAFAAAARLGKNDPDILNSYAGFLCRTGKAAEGEKIFIEVAQNPVYRTPEVALLNAGVCLGSSGDVVDAERYFNRALTIKPNMPEALLQLGNLAYSRGDYKQALDDVQRYLAVNPPSAEILMARLSHAAQVGRQRRRDRLWPAHSNRVSRFRSGPAAARRRRSMSEAAQALGQRLKAEREKRGMSAQKMADDMHLDAWVVDALEAGDYERIGPAVYAQGHLRKYASILGVSATQETPAPQAKLRVRRRPSPIIRLDPPGGSGSIWPTVGGVAVIALVAGGIVWWRPWHGSRAAAAAQVPRAASVPAPRSCAEQRGCGLRGDGRRTKPRRQREPRRGGDEASCTLAGAPAGTAPSAPSAAPRAARPRAELTPGVGRARLRLSFSADSRVAIYDYTGKPVFTGNGRANSVKTLAGMAPFRVYLGLASGVQLQVNDRAVAIGPQFVSGDVARFEAGADGVLRRDPHPLPAAAPAPASPAPAAPRG